jgi:hypothetical protein
MAFQSFNIHKSSKKELKFQSQPWYASHNVNQLYWQSLEEPLSRTPRMHVEQPISPTTVQIFLFSSHIFHPPLHPKSWLRLPHLPHLFLGQHLRFRHLLDIQQLLHLEYLTGHIRGDGMVDCVHPFSQAQRREDTAVFLGHANGRAHEGDAEVGFWGYRSHCFL